MSDGKKLSLSTGPGAGVGAESWSGSGSPHPETSFVKKQNMFAVWFVQTSGPSPSSSSSLVALPFCLGFMLVLSLAPSLVERQRWLILVHWSISATTETDLQGGIINNLSCCSPLDNQRRVMTGRAAILVPQRGQRRPESNIFLGDPTLS